MYPDALNFSSNVENIKDFAAVKRKYLRFLAIVSGGNFPHEVILSQPLPFDSINATVASNDIQNNMRQTAFSAAAFTKLPAIVAAADDKYVIYYNTQRQFAVKHGMGEDMQRQLCLRFAIKLKNFGQTL